MRILIATDAWPPQVNGVVRTLQATTAELRKRGHGVHVLSPEGRRGVPMPFYPEIPLALATAAGLGREIDTFAPDAIHIATEGPIGRAARRHCLRNQLDFTSGFHTRFPDYVVERLPLPGVARLCWSLLRDFHRPSRGVMAPTRTLARDLEARGFANVRLWTRGVDHAAFKPMDRDYFSLPRPIALCAGRLAPEKNIAAFLDMDFPGTKVVVGDGPQRGELQRRFGAAVFTGYLFGEKLTRALSAADVFVFPSRTDTFGLVMLEAMACGTPVAAYNVPSPVDVIEEGVSGVLHADLGRAAREALALDRGKVHEASKAFTWQRTAELFESFLVPAAGKAAVAARTSPWPFHLR